MTKYWYVDPPQESWSEYVVPVVLPIFDPLRYTSYDVAPVTPFHERDVRFDELMLALSVTPLGMRVMVFELPDAPE